MHQDGRLYGRQIRVPNLGITTAIWADAARRQPRVPDWNTFDVRIQKDFGIGGSARLGVFGDILNLTNIDANERVASQNGAGDELRRADALPVSAPSDGRGENQVLGF